MDKFALDHYTMTQKVLSVGKKYYIKDRDGRDLFYARMEKYSLIPKELKLKQKILVYSDDTLDDEILSIVPGSLMAFNATYSVFDSRAHRCVGALKREGMHSLFRNRWSILDAEGRLMGTATENWLKAFIRRLIVNRKLNLEIEVEKWHVGSLTRARSIKDSYVLDLSNDHENWFDRRLAVAFMLLLDVVENG